MPAWILRATLYAKNFMLTMSTIATCFFFFFCIIWEHLAGFWNSASADFEYFDYFDRFWVCFYWLKKGVWLWWERNLFLIRPFFISLFSASWKHDKLCKFTKKCWGTGIHRLNWGCGNLLIGIHI